jgi:hypothetical protein
VPMSLGRCCFHMSTSAKILEREAIVPHVSQVTDFLCRYLRQCQEMSAALICSGYAAEMARTSA